MAIYVKAHRRGKSLIKAYRKTVTTIATARARGNALGVSIARGGIALKQDRLRTKYNAGYRALNKGYDFTGFLYRTSLRAKGKKTSKYG